ncbi:DUF11 domain-containing protein [Nakamurella silvestris]|nr:DUF11 domain-containing protein [Nakamurella silvestris]
MGHRLLKVGAGRRSLALLTAVVLGLGSAAAVDLVASAADPTASMTITKQASETTVIPGQVFEYTIEFQCTAGTVSGCVNAAISDVLPAGLIVAQTPDISGPAAAAATVDVSGNTVGITFGDDLGAGQKGLDAGASSTLTISVRVDPDIPYSASGVPLVNTARITADNADPKQAPATVTPQVPLELDAVTTKAIEPAGALPVPGTPLTATLTGENTSNAAVDTLTITDPVDPAATPNPFTYLGLTSLGTVALPPGADTVQVRVWVGGSWTAGPVGPPAALPPVVDPATVTGLQFIFTSTDGADIAPGDAASVGLNLAQRDNVTELTGPITITNTAVTTVALGEARGTSDPASDTYRIPPSDLAVEATKRFDPDVVRAGDPSTVTLTGTNTSELALDTLTVTEPRPGSDNPFADGGLTFTGLGTDGNGGGIQWPRGATAATITYTCAGTGAGAPVPAAGIGTLPPPPAGCTVIGFAATFTGGTASGGQAVIPFTVTTAEDQDTDEVVRSNQVGVTGSLGQATTQSQATDEITSLIDRLAVTVAKRISPAQINSAPGQIATVGLTGTLSPFPASTVDAHQLVVADPADLAADTWWDAFQARSVAATPVPAESTLTVQYWDGTAWVDVPGMVAIPGPTVFSGELPAAVKGSAQGIRFVYDSEQGFPPGTSVKPNLAFTLRPAMAGEDGTVTDCARSAASNGRLTAAATQTVCPEITLVPPTPGVADLVEKDWDPDKLVNARSGNEIGATLRWSTGGYSGVDSLVLTDTGDPTGTALDQSVFDSFDLVRIDPVTTATDPLLIYDQVASVQLYRLPAGSTDPTAGQWVDAAADPCPAACDGTFPGLALSPAERVNTIGFRLTYQESPTRGPRTGNDPAAPEPGSGVAASNGDNRAVHPVFAVRDELRSNEDVPVTAEHVYNLPGRAGEVRNTVRAEAFVGAERILTDDAADDVALVDIPVTVKAEKTWSGGPLGIPAVGVPADRHPTGRATVSVQNTTPAEVDQLVIIDPAGGSNPFDAFDLTRFVTIPDPQTIGASTVVITLTDTAANSSSYTRAQALALTAPQLADVVGIRIVYTGRITAGARAAVSFDTRLRAQARSDQRPPVAGQTFTNEMEGTATDLLDYPGVDPVTSSDDDQATISVQQQGVGVTTGKVFTPTNQTEPDNTPVRVTLSGQPAGPSRTTTMSLTDTSATFWNQYDFVDLAPITLTAPITRVQVDAFTGGTWTLVGGQPVLTGGSWHTGAATTAANLALPNDVSPGQVQGIRYIFTRADGSNWENPATPNQSAPFLVKRRAELNTGGPVPSTLVGSAPAPGETSAGTATNTVTAKVTSSDVDADGIPLTASTDATARIVYRHATNAVQVTKTPSGDVKQPGAAFPYTLTFKNTGQVPIENPVVTDRLPVDGDGPLVVFPDGGTTYTYTLTPAGSGPTALPTDPAAVTVTATGTGITFRFPAGSRLEIGQTYSISFPMQTRPGLAANTPFTNVFGVVADRAWDQCSGTLDVSGECRASATNTVLSAGALSVRKLVKGEDSNLLGVITDPAVTAAVTCTPNAAGFYGRPCIPVTRPGGDITWRMEFQNSGNRPIDRIVAVDRLPAVGDRLATANLARGSQWQPLLSGPPPALVNPSSGTLKAWYTTDATPCAADLATDATNCPAGAWTPWTAALTIDPATVTGVKYEILPATPLAPAAFTNVDLRMVAPAYTPELTKNAVAYNTIGMSGRWVNNQTKGYTLTTEPPRVGVALATGPVQVLKTVAGDAAEQYAPVTFTATLDCTSVGQQVPLGNQADLTLTPGEPVTVENLPWGSRCTVEESDQGQTSWSASTVTVTQDPIEIPTISVTNIYRYASLVVSKVVSTSAVDQVGTPIGYGPFIFGVSCTYLGNPVYAQGYGPDAPMNAVLADAGSSQFLHLPAGADCTVTETDAKGAVSITAVATAGDADPVTSEGPSVDITLAPDGELVPADLVDVTNTYDTGTISIVKEVIGDAAQEYGAGPFTAHLTCTLDDESGSRSVWDGDLLLGGGHPLTATVENIAAGAECTVTETDSAGATSVSIAPQDPILVAGNETGTVTITNSFDIGELELVKQVSGGAAAYAPDAFEVQVDCTVDGNPLPGFPRTVSVSTSAPTRVPTLAGSVCTASETGSGGATTVTYDPTGTDDLSGPVDITAEDPAVATITNEFRSGGLRIVKDLTGPGSAIGSGPFTFAITCEYNGTAAAYQGEITLTREGSGTSLTSPVVPGLPVGAVCVVTETNSGGADAVPAPVTVTIPDGGPAGPEAVVTAGFINTFSAARLEIAKVVTGTGADAAAGKTFTVAVSCELPSADGPVTVFSGPLLIKGGQTLAVTVADGSELLVPIGTHCYAAETDTGGATGVGIDFDSYDRAAVAQLAVELQTLTITVTNTFTAPEPPTTGPTTGPSTTGPTTGPTGPGTTGPSVTIAPTSAPSTPPVPPGTGGLPVTGAPVTHQLVLIAALLAAGLLLVGYGRRGRGSSGRGSRQH